MQVTALCFRLLMTVLLLLVAQVDLIYPQKADVGFPQVVPNRQQHFQYESIVVSCEGLEGLTGWRVMRNIKGSVITCAATWSTSTGPCQIKTAFPGPDSGEYWCEIGEKRSNGVNITVTAGSVILESPVLPVMEGDNVTLCCRTKQTSSNLNAEFYKHGYFMESSSTGTMTIHSVTSSNEGLYRCSISGAGESAESWLTVRAAREEPPSHPFPQLYLLLSVGVGVFLVFLMVVVGLLQRGKNQKIITGTTTSPSQSPPSPQTVSGEASVADPMQATYSVVTKPRNKNDPGAPGFLATPVLSAGTNPLTEEDHHYYEINN